MERGEEIRCRGYMETDTAFHLLSILWSSSPSSSPLPFLLRLPLSSSSTGFGSGFVFFLSFSFHLFFVSPSLSLSWLCCHGYRIIPTWSASAEDGRRMESNLVWQNTPSCVQASTDKHITCRSARKTALHGRECFSRQLFSSVML